MAMRVSPTCIGIDVAKDELVIHDWTHDTSQTMVNTRTAIRKWLKTLVGPTRLAVEATGTYHIEVAEQAWRAGVTVYVVDGYQLKHYREGLRHRAKTDTTDARLIARFLFKEGDDLRPWTPPPKAYTQLQSLLKRRARVIQARVALQQSLACESALKSALEQLIRQINRIDWGIQKQLRQATHRAGLHDQVARCQAIEGVGLLTATALVMAFLRGDFRNSDAFIAFLGLDVRVRDSGKQRQRRRLSKRGNPEIRRLLHNAAMAARRTPHWLKLYEYHRARGLQTTQVFVILARKLARIAFALLKNGTAYQPRAKMTCSTT